MDTGIVAVNKWYPNLSWKKDINLIFVFSLKKLEKLFENCAQCFLWKETEKFYNFFREMLKEIDDVIYIDPTVE